MNRGNFKGPKIISIALPEMDCFMKPALVFAILFLFNLENVHAQKVKRRTRDIVASIAAVDEVHCKGIGLGRVPSQQFKNYQRLCEGASTKELVLLTDHSNAVVRCYAFKCLADRSEVDLMPILVRHFSDNHTITVFCGCTKNISATLVGDFFLQVVTPNKVFSGLNSLTSQEQAFVDSMLLFGPDVTIRAKYYLLARIKPKTEKWYERIRQISFKEPAAVMALARYQKSQDIPLIRNLLNNGFDYDAVRAIKEFPDTSFYADLLLLFEREWMQEYANDEIMMMLYQALSRYPLPQTLEAFERTLQPDPQFRKYFLKVYLKAALEKYPNSYFASLKEKIKLDEGQEFSVEFLLERDE